MKYSHKISILLNFALGILRRIVFLVTQVPPFIIWSFIFEAVGIYVPRFIIFNSCVVKLTVVKNQKMVPIGFHFIHGAVVVPKPAQYLFAAAGVNVFNSLH